MTTAWSQSSRANSSAGEQLAEPAPRLTEGGSLGICGSRPSGGGAQFVLERHSSEQGRAGAGGLCGTAARSPVSGLVRRPGGPERL